MWKTTRSLEKLSGIESLGPWIMTHDNEANEMSTNYDEAVVRIVMTKHGLKSSRNEEKCLWALGH